MVKTKTLTGERLNRAFAMAIGARVAFRCPTPWAGPGRKPIQPNPVWCDFRGHTNSGEEIWYQLTDYTREEAIGLVWPIIKKHLISIDAGDGSFKGERRWAAYLAENVPLSRDEEITAADPQIAALLAFVHSVYGDDIDLED